MPSPCQVELERERAQLLVRATMAEEQLSELQEYVDQHLGRWAGCDLQASVPGNSTTRPVPDPDSS